MGNQTFDTNKLNLLHMWQSSNYKRETTGLKMPLKIYWIYAKALSSGINLLVELLPAKETNTCTIDLTKSNHTKKKKKSRKKNYACFNSKILGYQISAIISSEILL